MNRAEKTFRIWFAGFFDGEGSIGIYMTNRRNGTVQFEPKFSVYQKDEAFIRDLQTHLGGVLHRSGGNNPQHRGWGLVWSWRRAVKIAHYLQPYLRRKREQCDVFLHAMREFAKYRHTAKGFSRGRRLPDDVVAARKTLANSVNIFNAVPGSKKKGPKPKTTPSEADRALNVAGDEVGT